jgi:hypothetical protein
LLVSQFDSNENGVEWQPRKHKYNHDHHQHFDDLHLFGGKGNQIASLVDRKKKNNNLRKYTSKGKIPPA